MSEIDEARKPEPIPMYLTCPKCCARHIDEGDFATKVHHAHSCQSCGLTWRPAVVPTVGVQFLPGFKNESRPPNPEAPATFDATLYGPGKKERPAEKCPTCKGCGAVAMGKAVGLPGYVPCPTTTRCPDCKGSGSAPRESQPANKHIGQSLEAFFRETGEWDDVCAAAGLARKAASESDPSATSERTEDGIRISERGDRGSEAARGGAPGERGPDGGERVPSDSSVGGRVGDALGKQPVARKSYPAEGGVARPSSGGAPDPLPEVLPAGTRFNLGNGEWEFLVTARRVPGADAPGWYSGMARHLLGITDEAHVKATSIDWSSLPPSDPAEAAK